MKLAGNRDCADLPNKTLEWNRSYFQATLRCISLCIPLFDVLMERRCLAKRDRYNSSRLIVADAHFSLRPAKTDCKGVGP